MPRRLVFTSIAAIALTIPLAVTAGASVTRARTADAGTSIEGEAARTVQVPSFDGIELVVNFFPAAGLAAGDRAPSVLLGHGWGGRGETNPDGGQTGPLRAAGYNVLTWNARGFGSPGQAHVDYAPVEGRDVRALIDWLSRQPEARLDGWADPRVGMAGGSYGGAIQFVAAGLDRRVDVIAPTISYDSVIDSLYPERNYKAGWGNLLCQAGTAGGNQIAPNVASACASGQADGTISPADYAWFRDHDLAPLVRRIRVPTLIIQGTVDTLFPLRQAVHNYAILAANRVPVKMVWFCGGHGVCSARPGPGDHVGRATLAWFDRYLKGQKQVATGPGFEYVDDSGTLRGGARYPLPPAGRLRAAGKETISFTPADTSGNAIAAQPAAKAISVAVPAPARAGQAVGAPRLELTYKGTADRASTVVYAQLVDERAGIVLGNQATPIPVILDGRTRTVHRPLESVAWRVAPDSRLVLQIIPGTGLFVPQRATGSITARASVRIPMVRPGDVLTR